MHFRPLGYAMHADANKQFFLVLNKMGWAKKDMLQKYLSWNINSF